jgi:hypothetical protein
MMQKIGFLVYSAEAITPTYLGAIQGLNITDDHIDVTAVHDLVDETFCMLEVATIIADASADNHNFVGMGDAERTLEILDTLVVDIIGICAKGGVDRPFVNVYINCPCSDNDWAHLVAAVAKLEYRVSLLGTGAYYAGWTCTNCHGADHPGGKCPL